MFAACRKFPPRLDVIFQKYDPPLYFVTFNTQRRKRILANSGVHVLFIEFCRAGEERGIVVGRYVIMPDHIHLLVSPPHWQKGFFDHLIRHSESYSEKWNYVYQNPVRAGLVRKPDHWLWQGKIEEL